MTQRIARTLPQHGGHRIPTTMLAAILAAVVAAGYSPGASAQWSYSSGQQWSYGETGARPATDGTVATTPTNTLSPQEQAAIAERQAVAAGTWVPRTNYPSTGATYQAPTNTLSSQEQAAQAERQAVAAGTWVPRANSPATGASYGGTGATDVSHSGPTTVTNAIAASDRNYMGSAEMKVYQACGTTDQQSAAWENPETGHSGQYYVAQSGRKEDGRYWFKIQGTDQSGSLAWTQTAIVLKNMDTGTWTISEISATR